MQNLPTFYHIEPMSHSTYNLPANQGFIKQNNGKPFCVNSVDINHRFVNVMVYKGIVCVSTDLLEWLGVQVRYMDVAPYRKVGRKNFWKLDSVLDSIIQSYGYHARSEQQFGLKPNSAEAFTAKRNEQIAEWLVNLSS